MPDIVVVDFGAKPTIALQLITGPAKLLITATYRSEKN